MYPQKMPCTPKIQPLGVHVPSNKFVSGHAVMLNEQPEKFIVQMTTTNLLIRPMTTTNLLIRDEEEIMKKKR